MDYLSFSSDNHQSNTSERDSLEEIVTNIGSPRDARKIKSCSLLIKRVDECFLFFCSMAELKKKEDLLSDDELERELERGDFPSLDSGEEIDDDDLLLELEEMLNS